MAVNGTHAIFVRRGLKHGKAKPAGKKSLPALDFRRLTRVERIEPKSLRRRAPDATADVNGLDAAIEKTAEGFDGHEGLTCIKGVGTRSAAVFLAAARGFPAIIRDTLDNGWVFEDFAAFEIGEGRGSQRGW